MSYSENLLYQMKYFPEIMKSYRFTADRAVKIEKECLEGEKTFVYILLTGEKTVAETVEELFLVRIPEQMQGCGFCTVEYSLQDEVFYSQEGLWVRTMHSFYDGICCRQLLPLPFGKSSGRCDKKVTCAVSVRKQGTGFV